MKGFRNRAEQRTPTGLPMEERALELDFARHSWILIPHPTSNSTIPWRWCLVVPAVLSVTVVNDLLQGGFPHKFPGIQLWLSRLRTKIGKPVFCIGSTPGCGSTHLFLVMRSDLVRIMIAEHVLSHISR